MGNSKMNEVAISVIIPTFNRGAFIERSVMSVVEQDCVPEGVVEVLVLDDGSTDNTQQVMNLVRQKPLRQTVVYRKLPHVGEPGTVRNVGLREARGKYIAYCDSDDFWLPHHLATAMQVFKRRPDLGMVSNFWALARFQVNGNSISTQIVVPHHPPDSVNTNCRVHRRECIKKVGNFNRSCWGEDCDFFSRIEKEFSCIKTGIVTSINGYIKGGNNLTYRFDQGVRSVYY